VRLLRLVSDYRWPLFLAGLLGMSIAACGVLVWVATRPDAPRPIRGYYEAARAWDVEEATVAASRALGWTVRFELPGEIPYFEGMPRPVDVRITDRAGAGVAGLSGELHAVRPADGRLNQRGELVAMPDAPGSYRTLIRLDAPGDWELRLDLRQEELRFVHAARFTLMLPPEESE
jgi:hypothetical protein